jgi:predicted transcriptional regulator
MLGTMDDPDIVAGVVTRLQGIDRTSREIAAEIGVPESWLRMFRRGKIPNPGVRQFRKVEAYVLLHSSADARADA